MTCLCRRCFGCIECSGWRCIGGRSTVGGYCCIEVSGCIGVFGCIWVCLFIGVNDCICSCCCISGILRVKLPLAFNCFISNSCLWKGTESRRCCCCCCCCCRLRRLNLDSFCANFLDKFRSSIFSFLMIKSRDLSESLPAKMADGDDEDDGWRSFHFCPRFSPPLPTTKAECANCEQAPAKVRDGNWRHVNDAPAVVFRKSNKPCLAAKGWS